MPCQNRVLLYFCMPFRAVLFDLDGTLLYTLKDIADSANEALRRAGLPTHEVDEYRYFVGDGTPVLIKRAIPPGRRDDATVKHVLELFREEYSVRWSRTTAPYPGIPEMLDTISECGIRKCILSNKEQRFTELTVERLLPRWRFDAVVGARPDVPTKPDPTAAISIARELQISPTDFLYLGDSGIDMKTAVASAMYPVGALWGFRTADELTSAGAKELIDRPARLPGVICRSHSSKPSDSHLPLGG